MLAADDRYKYRIAMYLDEMSNASRQLILGTLLMDLDMNLNELMAKVHAPKDSYDPKAFFTEAELRQILRTINQVRPYKKRLTLENLLNK